MTEQTFTIGRDVEFDILLQDASGAVIDPAGMTFRLRIYPQAGRGVAPVIDVASGSGISMLASPARLRVAAGAMPDQDPSFGTVDLTRTDTGADLWEAWPCRIIRAGEPRTDYLGNIVIRNGPDIVLTLAASTPGIQGAAGPAGVSSLVAGVVPLFPNGDFALWGKGIGPYDVTGVIAEGVRFTKGSGSTHAVARGAAINPASDFSLSWGRSVAGSVLSSLQFRIEDLRQFHGRTFLFALDHVGAASIDAQSVVTLNYGSGGSPTDTILAAANFSMTTTPGVLTRNAAIDLTGKTIGAGAYLEVVIQRLIAQANGTIRLGNLRAWLGTTDFGLAPIAAALRDQMCRRRFQVINTRTINGVTRVYFPVAMRVAPAITATVGTVSNITTESCDLTHTSAAASVLTCDAEL